MRHDPFLIVLILMVSALPVSSFQLSPPPQFPLDVAPTATLRRAPSSSLKLGSLVITLDETTLEDAVSKIGIGKIAHQGDASESTYWLCYSVGGPRQKERLWLMSNESGPRQVIYGVAAQIRSGNKATDACPELPKTFQPVILDSGIWLGATSAEIRSKFGKPSLERDSWIHYDSKRELPGDPRAKEFGTDILYEYAGLSLRIRSRKTVELWATKSASD